MLLYYVDINYSIDKQQKWIKYYKYKSNKNTELFEAETQARHRIAGPQSQTVISNGLNKLFVYP
jgi:hypothetical protein